MMRGAWDPLRTRKPPQVGSPVPPAKEADGEQLMALVAPAPPELMFPLMASGWVWLKRLKFSHRNSKAYRSLKAKRLKSPKSKLTRPGRRSEEHTSELQSPDHLLFRLLLEK